MDKLNIATIIERISSKTPPFWIKIRKMMLTLGAVGTAIVVVPAEHTAWLPGNTASILITIGAVGTALSSLTANQTKGEVK